jgi:hypothetical protein
MVATDPISTTLRRAFEVMLARTDVRRGRRAPGGGVACVGS